MILNVVDLQFWTHKTTINPLPSGDRIFLDIPQFKFSSIVVCWLIVVCRCLYSLLPYTRTFNKKKNHVVFPSASGVLIEYTKWVTEPLVLIPPYKTAVKPAPKFFSKNVHLRDRQFGKTRTHCGGNIAEPWSCFPNVEFVADTKNVSENLQKPFLCPVSVQQCCRVNFATDGQHRRTQCSHHNVSSFCQGFILFVCCLCSSSW